LNFDDVLLSAQAEGLTYAEVLGPLLNLTAQVAAASAIQTDTHPDVIADIIQHELDFLLTRYLDEYQRQAAR
jgi:hypothetical protein